MTRLAPHVLETVKRAHIRATQDLDDATRELQRVQANHTRAAASLKEHRQRVAELSTALKAHETAIADDCPSCGMTDNEHTGGCRAIAQELDKYATERRQRAQQDLWAGIEPAQVAQPAQTDAARASKALDQLADVGRELSARHQRVQAAQAAHVDAHGTPLG